MLGFVIRTLETRDGYVPSFSRFGPLVNHFPLLVSISSRFQGPLVNTAKPIFSSLISSAFATSSSINFICLLATPRGGARRLFFALLKARLTNGPDNGVREVIECTLRVGRSGGRYGSDSQIGEFEHLCASRSVEMEHPVQGLSMTAGAGHRLIDRGGRNSLHTLVSTCSGL